MTRRPTIGQRPRSELEARKWVRIGDVGEPVTSAVRPEVHTARLTVDVTPTLRGQIKITAFKRGVTVAALVRELLVREFGQGAETR